jgi:hypothetical protein
LILSGILIFQIVHLRGIIPLSIRDLYMDLTVKLPLALRFQIRACLGNGGFKWIEEDWRGFWEFLTYSGNSSTPMPFIPGHSTVSQTSPKNVFSSIKRDTKDLYHKIKPLMEEWAGLGHYKGPDCLPRWPRLHRTSEAKPPLARDGLVIGCLHSWSMARLSRWLVGWMACLPN